MLSDIVPVFLLTVVVNPPIIWQQQSIPHQFESREFDLAYWRSVPDSRELRGGRGASQLIQLEGQEYVLRHYLRGGLAARLLTDSYIWQGLSASRPHREQLAVHQALQYGLPVPRVAAYRVQRSGLFYRADIISEYIANRGTLASWLFERPVDENGWAELGQLIRRLHLAGIYHADLNANNILIDNHDKFYLIDFDKAVVETVTAAHAQANLDRLLRSLNKIRMQRHEAGQTFHFSGHDWETLQGAYEVADADAGESR